MISRLCDPARNILTPIGVNTEPFCDMAGKERRTASDTLRAAVEKEVEKLRRMARRKSKP